MCIRDSLEGRKFTCFPGVEEQIASGDHQTDLVVVDDNIVTSRGAGTALALSFIHISDFQREDDCA